MPNALDATLWLQPLDNTRLEALRKQHRLSPERPRILYMGTRSHAKDLALIAEAVEEIVRAQPEIDIIQIGGGTPLPRARMLTPPKDCSSYPEFVAWFRHIAATATIALAPLEDSAFNDAKSDIKTLDYGLARVPAMFSRVGPYQASVEHGKTGLLCRNETGEWIKAMHQLLEDASLREAIEAAAFERAGDRSRNAYTEPMWTRLFHQILTTRFSQDATGKRQSPERASNVVTESETA
jgi:glycosyltransferase involved in cell wall biosynthesis